MRRQHLTQLIGTFAVATALIGLPTAAFAVITDSAHDLSGQTYTTEICNVCHTPHNGDTTVTTAPLWDHTETTASFTIYSSTTLNASVGAPSGVSKLCLSCHDGSVAIDAFGGNATPTTNMTGAALVGTDLKNDHPISFTYNTALANDDGGLWDPSAVDSGPDSTIDADLLFAGQLECASCHDVHNETGLPNLLQVTNVDSELCLTCHNK
jgi:predicted CXXCH cytochrome family protein